MAKAATPLPAWRRAGRVAGCLVAAAAAVVYAVTLAPTVTGGQSGAWLAAFAGGGQAPPPAQPLWEMLARTLALLPAGSLAGRVHVVSAFSMAAAAGLMALALSRLTRCLPAAVAVAGAWAFSPLVWQHAVRAGPAGTDALVLAAFCYGVVRYYDDGGSRTLAVTGLLFVLAVASDPVSLFVLAPLAAVLVRRAREVVPAPQRLRLAAVAACGLLPALIWSVHAASRPAQRWGAAAGLTDVGAWVQIGQALPPDVGVAAAGVGDHLALAGICAAALLRQLLVLGAIPLALALVLAVRRRARDPAAAVLGAALCLTCVLGHLTAPHPAPVADSLGVRALTVYWLLPLQWIFLLTGIGAARLMQSPPGWWRWLVWLVVAGVVGAQLWWSWPSHDPAPRRLQVYGEALLSAVPDDAVYIAGGQNAALARFAQEVRDYRRDVTVVDALALQAALQRPGVPMGPAGWQDAFAELAAEVGDEGVTLGELFAACDGRVEVVVDRLDQRIWRDDISWRGSHRLEPWGLVFRVQPQHRDTDLDALMLACDGALQFRQRVCAPPPVAGTWHAAAATNFWRAVRAQTEFLLADPERSEARARLAAFRIDQLLAHHPQPTADDYRHAVIAYGRVSRRLPAENARLQSAAEQFLDLSAANHPFRRQAEAVLEKEIEP
jgi:hypothetical protein